MLLGKTLYSHHTFFPECLSIEVTSEYSMLPQDVKLSNS